ncbi:MAG: DNA methyltransferase [Thermoplasmatota archaeon]
MAGSPGIVDQLERFRFEEDGRTGGPTRTETFGAGGSMLTRYVNEFWTPRQRQGSSIHEISYRACFKPQLPRFFIERMSKASDVVLDPFSGRGTTVVEAALLGRRVISNDVNPLSMILTRPRLEPPTMDEVKSRLASIGLKEDGETNGPDLSMFYHEDTLREILSLRRYLEDRSKDGSEDHIDRWLRMVATNRLTGHSGGFFSVYTLPPNQAVSPERQKLINKKLVQVPDYRDVSKLITRKTRSLLRGVSEDDREKLREGSVTARFLELPAGDLSDVDGGGVELTVTSPPFLNIVQYSQDNWLRCWFNGIDPKEVDERITAPASLEAWASEMGSVFNELYRVTREGGHVAFEVGEVRNRKINLDETIAPLGLEAGFKCLGVLVNEQVFTKTSNIWGVSNNRRGTNTNRVVLFRK